MTNDIRKALILMGYREMSPEVWGKPFAYQLLTVHKVKDKWKLTNYFKGPERIHIWACRGFEDINSLKYAEMEICKIIMNGQPSEFEFGKYEMMDL